MTETNFYVIYDVFPGDFDVYDNVRLRSFAVRAAHADTAGPVVPLFHRHHQPVDLARAASSSSQR